MLKKDIYKVGGKTRHILRYNKEKICWKGDMVIAICKHHTFNMNRAESILFSRELLSDFIDQYLNGDIEKICSFDFAEVPQASRFGKPKDYKEDWLLDPDDSLIMRSILFLIYYPEIPDLTLDLIGNIYRGDTLFTLGNILGRNDEFWERQELNPKDDADFLNMVDSFKSAYHTLPNIILLPNKKIEVMRERNQKKK